MELGGEGGGREECLWNKASKSVERDAIKCTSGECVP